MAPTRAEQFEDGLGRRALVSRSAHGDWRAAPDRPDPVDVLLASNAGRLEELIPIRLGAPGERREDHTQLLRKDRHARRARCRQSLPDGTCSRRKRGEGRRSAGHVVAALVTPYPRSGWPGSGVCGRDRRSRCGSCCWRPRGSQGPRGPNEAFAAAIRSGRVEVLEGAWTARSQPGRCFHPGRVQGAVLDQRPTNVTRGRVTDSRCTCARINTCGRSQQHREKPETPDAASAAGADSPHGDSHADL